MASAKYKSAPHAAGRAAVCTGLGVDGLLGLTPAEASVRRNQVGANTLPEPESPSRVALLGRQLASPLVGLLAVAAVVSVVAGASVDAVIIGAIVVANALLGFVQESRAESAAHQLQEILSPVAVAVREGHATRIDASLLVPGDVMLLGPGDRVGADARLLEAAALEADESALTGESLPVDKRPEPPVAADTPLAERSTMVLAGTMITHGSARAVVTATGTTTELGRTVARAAATRPPPTPLQRRIAGFARTLVQAASGICLVLGGLAWVQGETLLESIRIGVALAVAAVPEGLPAVLTVALAIGVQRMARRGAIVRRLQAVETLGSATLICADKTGTLTEGRMALDRAWVGDRELRLHEDAAIDPDARAQARALLGAALIASQTETGPLTEPSAELANLTEAAIVAAGERLGASPREVEPAGVVIAVEPFDAERKRMTVVVESVPGIRTAYVKGAPEAILPNLGRPEEAARLAAVASRWARTGTRVLIVARSDGGPGASAPDAALEPIGLLGFRDPPREGALQSVAEARSAGVRTVMITGDHPETALAIARATGIAGASEVDVVTGTELDHLDGDAMPARILSASVFARVTPEHKVRIVEAFREAGEVIAMTGDGINDVPALQAAHIGVAMGKRGTDAARAAADMVLTDDDYSTIVRAIRRGRAVYDNVLSFVHLLLAANAGEILVFALAIGLGLSAPLTILQILLVNLLTDGLPALALGLDRPRRDVMRRGPRPPDERLLDPIGVFLVLGGITTGLTAFGSFLLGLETSEELGQTMAFTTLVFAQLAYVFAVRGEGWIPRAGRNLALYVAVLVSGAVQVAVLTLPGLSERFGVVAMSATHLAAALGLAAIPFLTLVAFKALRGRAELSSDYGSGSEKPAG